MTKMVITLIEQAERGLGAAAHVVATPFLAIGLLGCGAFAFRAMSAVPVEARPQFSRGARRR